MRLPLLAMSIVSLAGLVGCTMDNSPFKKTEYTQASNPAAVYCVEQDGTLETITEDSQRVTYCVLPDGSKVEQWEHYLARHSKDKTSQ